MKQCELSSIAQVEAKRQQVWKVWNEVQSLQKDIRETMVSTVTTSALENCIRDSEVWSFSRQVRVEHFALANRTLRTDVHLSFPISRKKS